MDAEAPMLAGKAAELMRKLQAEEEVSMATALSKP